MEEVQPGSSPPARARRRRGGFTVIELLVSVVVLSLLFVALGTCLASSIVAERETMASTIVDDLHRNVFDRLAFELRYAMNVSLTPAVNATSITYEPVTGWAGSSPVLDPAKTLQFAGGQILLDGAVIASGVSNLTMNLNGTLLTVVVDIDPATFGSGTDASEIRQLSALLRVKG